MKISAVTLIKNALIYDYPIIESINSLLPYVDEYIVNVGRSEDATDELIASNFESSQKVKIYNTRWQGKEEGTTFFSTQTNFSVDKATGDWVIYLQADECFHENEVKNILKWIYVAEQEGKSGITVNYYHFEKAPNLIRKTYKDGYDAYDKEIRIFKNDGRMVSFGDGQSFAFLEDLTDPRGPQPALHRKDRFLESDINIFHYGYLRDPKKLYNKKKDLEEFYKVSEPGRSEKIEKDENGNYIFNGDDKLKPFLGSHPAVMHGRLVNYINIEENNA